jgi:sugar/nucleoside kinase (ribokinase family)
LNVCSFGTTRLDFHIYKPEIISPEYKEVKIDSLDIKVGGSVFNTATLLKYLGMNLTFYTILGNDELSWVSKSALRNYGIRYMCTSSIESKSPVTFIHLDSTGEKVMFSYEGNSQPDEIIDILRGDCQEYGAFFTSCYEINTENYEKLKDVLEYFYINNKKTFLDLSPLAYMISKNIWETLLPFITVMTGTESEFKLLNDILDIGTLEELMSKFNMNKLFIKKGSKGCSVVLESTQVIDFPIIPVKSKNLTGCGDAFNAGVIFGELNNLSIDNIVELSSSLAGNVARIGFDPSKITSEIKLSSFLSK